MKGMVPMGAGQRVAAVASAGLPVVVIGGGPVGLAAAANLLERGLEPLVLEAGDRVGSAISEWGHVSLFSPWAFTVDPASRRLLNRTAWREPDPKALPTGRDLVEGYLAPLAATPELAGRIRTGTRVVAVTRQGVDKTRTLGRDGRPYLVRALTVDGVSDIAAAAVIDASGTWGRPNPLGSAGLPAALVPLENVGSRLNNSAPPRNCSLSCDVLNLRSDCNLEESGNGRLRADNQRESCSR